MTPLEKLRQQRSDYEKETSLRRLKTAMSAGGHLKDVDGVTTLIKNADRHWSTFTDTERDYIRLARYALVNQTAWKL